MIEIWEPRYKDLTVLIMTSKLKSAVDNPIEITKGAYKGKYIVPKEVLPDCNTELKPTKSGFVVKFTIVPLNKLKKIGEQNA